jgi:hypothetical protein
MLSVVMNEKLSDAKINLEAQLAAPDGALTGHLGKQAAGRFHHSGLMTQINP